MTEPKKLGKIRCGQIAAWRSPILGNEDCLPFWVDDRVRRKNPEHSNPHLRALPGYQEGTRLVREIVRRGDEHEYLLSDGLFGGWQEAERADGLELAERGNVWKILNGEPPRFHDWREELSCRSLLGEAAIVHHPGGRSVRWHPDEARAFIGTGMADAFALFFPDRPPASAPVIRLYRFDDREAAGRVRPEALNELRKLFP